MSKAASSRNPAFLDRELVCTGWKELVYLANRRAYGRGARPVVGGYMPTVLVKEGYVTTPHFVSRTYDISSDGQRFLLLKEGGGTDQTSAPPQVIVVQHWTEELKRLVPTR